MDNPALSCALGHLIKFNPPAAVANPRLRELRGDVEFQCAKSPSAGEDDAGGAGEGSRTVPQLLLSGDGPWTRLGPWQRGRWLPVPLPFEWRLSGQPSSAQ